MNRSDLILSLTARLPEIHAEDVDTAVRLILEAMTHALAKGERVEIRGFGALSLTRHAPRIGRNPLSGETVLVPARARIHFRPGKGLRDQVNATAPAGAPPGNIAEPQEAFQ
jgi:integration host factor subunit beta